MALAQAKIQTKTYTEEDYYDIPEDVRAELIRGQIYYMASPTREHQEILVFLFKKITRYIDEKEAIVKFIPRHSPSSCSMTRKPSSNRT